MPKKFKISKEDIDAFHNAMKGTKPLQKKDRILPSALAPKSIKPPIIEEEDFKLSEEQVLAPSLRDEFILYKRNEVANKILRKLQKGQYTIEAILDLHGMSIAKASLALPHFLQRCRVKKVTLALIIHGKGHPGKMPILKNKLNHWLRGIDIVLAFCSATPAHGGSGAVYVLLKH